MELEDLDNTNKNDFLPLVDILNIKQELGDTAGGSSGTEAIHRATIIDGFEGNSESGYLLCNSIEKQVKKG